MTIEAPLERLLTTKPMVCNCFAIAQRQAPVVSEGNLQPTDDCKSSRSIGILCGARDNTYPHHISALLV